MAKKKKEKEVNFEFRIDDFELESHSVNRLKKEPKIFGYSIHFGQAQDLEKDFYFVRIKIEAKRKETSKSAFFSAETVTVFEIKNLSKYEELPIEVKVDLISLAYSTTRGYLLALNTDNFLGNVPLPLLNVDELEKLEKERMKLGEEANSAK